MTAPECFGTCTKTHYPNALINLPYWDQKGFKKCITCTIIINKNTYTENRCKCCHSRFRLKVKTRNLRKFKSNKKIDYSKIYCVVCGDRVDKKIYDDNRPRAYKFNNDYTKNLYECERCYRKRKYLQKKIDKALILLLPNNIKNKK